MYPDEQGIDRTLLFRSLARLRISQGEFGVGAVIPQGPSLSKPLISVRPPAC